MATTTVEHPAGPQVVQRGKNGGARPGSGPKTNAEKLVNGTLERPTLKRTPEDDAHFWDWLDQIKPDEWQYLICYLWRTGPIVDLSGGGKPITVEKIVHPFDATYIYKTHGSGSYRFDISQIPTDGSKQRRIRQSHQVLLDTRFPPRIPYGTWLDDARNKDWEWAKPALLEEAQRLSAAPVQEQQSPAQTLVDYLDVATKVKELSGGKEEPGITAVVIKMLESSNAALRDYQDPTKQMATLRSLLEFAGGGAKKEDSSLLLIVELMREQNKDLREELKAMRSQTQANPLDSVKPVLELMATLGVNLGGGGGGVRGGDSIASTVGDVLTKVIEKGTEVVPAIIGAYQFGKQKDLEIALHGAKTAATTGKPWEFDPSPARTPQPQQQPAAQAPPPPPTGPLTPQTFFVKWQGLFNEVYPRLLDCFNNETGDDFRDWFLDRKGGDLWAAFKKDATPELLTQLTQMHPQIKAAWQPEDKVLIFFSNMFDESEDEEEEDEPPILKPEVVA